MMEEYHPKLTINITVEQRRRIDNLIPWGLLSRTFNILLDDLLDMIEEGGEGFLMAFGLGKIKTVDIPQVLENIRKEKANGNRGPK